MSAGECNCGAIRFEIDADLSDIYMCHCSICRRATGSNGIAVLVVDRSDFRWTRGEEFIRTWRKPDSDWQTWFCLKCGSPVPGDNDESRVFIPAGLISPADETLAVKHHIWVDSKAKWDVIGDSGHQHREAFTLARREDTT